MAEELKVQTIESAMEAFGVCETTLTEEEKWHLDEHGYLVLHDVISPSVLESLRSKYEELMAKEGENAGREFSREAGTRRLSDLINKGLQFVLHGVAVASNVYSCCVMEKSV